jgi:hypothetical protein
MFPRDFPLLLGLLSATLLSPERPGVGGTNAGLGQQAGEKVFATESARRASKCLKPGIAGEGHVE